MMKIKGQFVFDSKNTDFVCLRRAKIEENKVKLFRNGTHLAKQLGTSFDKISPRGKSN